MVTRVGASNLISTSRKSLGWGLELETRNKQETGSREVWKQAAEVFKKHEVIFVFWVWVLARCGCATANKIVPKS